jgi:lipoprotein NlpI
MIPLLLVAVLSLSVFAAEKPEPIDAPPYLNLILEAQEAQAKGLMGKALEALDKAIQLDPKQVGGYFLKGKIFSLQRKPEEAIACFSKVIELDAKASSAFAGRADEEFKLGKFDESVADYNRYVELEPRRLPYEWKRGIALYYDGRFEEGRKQFELHQTVNPNDVENGVWHFLCGARTSGIEKARASMMSISKDSRVPMAEIYELFRGKGTEADVLKAVERGFPSEVELEARKFYAHLYLGLFYEATGDKKNCYEHIKQAATEFTSDDPMGDVARVHFKRLLAPGAR